MRYAQKSDIKELIEAPENSQAISIFLPTHRISLPHNLKADRVRMKNAIRDVVAHLEKSDLAKQEIGEYVKKLHDIHADVDFWRYRDNGLAIYAIRGKAVYFDLPLEIDFSVHIGRDFIISPLLASAEDNYRYYVLELNLEEPRLFVASQANFQRILTNELPGNLETALRIDEYQQQTNRGAAGSSNSQNHIHGHGGKSDYRQHDLERYYRLIDRILHEHILKNSSLPLVIAAEKRAAETFRKLSQYRYITEQILSGNKQHETEDSLHQQSWQVMSERIEKQENMFARLFEKARFRDHKQALITGAHIRKAASQGKVATLAISIVHRTYDSVVRRMEKRFKIALPSSKRQLRNIEQTARSVMKTGGDVRALLYSDYGSNEQYIKAISR